MENWTVKKAEDVTPAEPQSKQEVEQAVVKEAIAETPNVEIQGDSDVVKVNLDAPPPVKEEPKQEEDEQQVSNEQQIEQVEQPVQESGDAEEVSAPLELVSQEEPKEENLETVKVEAEPEVPQVAPVAQELPEGIDSLVDFMKETGGSLEDYLNLNKNVEDMDPGDTMYEYYKTTKPHLNDEEINFLMDDKFGWDEDASEKEVTKKKLQFKEELYDAQKYLKTQKDQYYKDLKFKHVDPEYKEAYEFHNNYKQSQEANQKLVDAFAERTNKVFNDDFKGFDFKVGENTYRYKVQDAAKTKEYQSDINNFIGDFLGEDGAISDAAGYHKAMFAAKNADKLAQHFYEQGRADAIKRSAAEAKNIDMKPRQDMSAALSPNTGTKVRAVDNKTFDGKLRFKNYNNR